MNEHLNRSLRLYLIRHPEVVGSEQGRLFGHHDVALSEHGLEQARRLADWLASKQLSAVHSSDLQRAAITAEMIAARHDLKVQSNSAWREIDMGDWDGQNIKHLYETEPDRVAALFADPEFFQYRGGESFTAFIVRVKKQLERVRATHRGEIALVAHGGVCRSIIGQALRIPVKFWLSLAQDAGCLNVIAWHDDNPTLELLNYRIGQHA